ncbi:c-type cytochrome [Rhodoferax ferrireducens]|uniref:c-type cytochrome n=1 Tax=Rhodoferax ferrireducens TaxID=192843 RepID=UPI000E0D565D|nr:c-type cytochrome [Rhodoferax ferrireducens]
MKLLTSLLLAASLAAPVFSSFAQEDKPAAPHAGAKAEPVKAAKPDLAKGEASYTAVCAACHAPDGNSAIPANPKLAQQHPEYLLKQLQEFKSGKRANPIMSGMVAALSDEDMKNIAYWVTAKPAKPGFAKEKELVTLGERIYRGGIPDRQVAACAGCHSPNGAGIPAQYPRLSGQHADYAVAQLNSFRDGTRKNSLQMAAVAAKMNDREIKAVADYVAGLR